MPVWSDSFVDDGALDAMARMADGDGRRMLNLVEAAVEHAARRQLAAVDDAVLDGVYEVLKISEPYKLAGRIFQPEDTIVDVGGVKIGGRRIVLMAGVITSYSIHYTKLYDGLNHTSPPHGYQPISHVRLMIRKMSEYPGIR